MIDSFIALLRAATVCYARQEPSHDVVKPEALAKIVELPRWVHGFTVRKTLSNWRQKYLGAAARLSWNPRICFAAAWLSVQVASTR